MDVAGGEEFQRHNNEKNASGRRPTTCPEKKAIVCRLKLKQKDLSRYDLGIS